MSGQNWQVQTMDGVVMSEHPTLTEAQAARDVLAKEYSQPMRIRRTA